MTFEEYRTQIAAYDCATYFEKYPEIDTTLEHLGRQFDQMEPAVRAHMLDSLEVAVEYVPDWMKIHFLSFCMAQKRDPHITENCWIRCLRQITVKSGSTINSVITGRSQERYLQTEP